MKLNRLEQACLNELLTMRANIISDGIDKHYRLSDLADEGEFTKASEAFVNIRLGEYSDAADRVVRNAVEHELDMQREGLVGKDVVTLAKLLATHRAKLHSGK